MLKKSLLHKIVLPFFVALFMVGCTSPSNQLVLNPTIANASPDPTLMARTVSISVNDARQDKALARVNRDGKLVTLTTSRDPVYLMQEVLDRQMRERGYMVGNTINNNSNATLQLTINQLFADVQEGNLHYSINSIVDVSLVARTPNGASYTKNYRTNHTLQGALSASNSNITNALNQTLSEVFTSMANDSEVNEFIKQNSR